MIEKSELKTTELNFEKRNITSKKNDKRGNIHFSCSRRHFMSGNSHYLTKTIKSRFTDALTPNSLNRFHENFERKKLKDFYDKKPIKPVYLLDYEVFFSRAPMQPSSRILWSLRIKDMTHVFPLATCWFVCTNG